jgi:trigger factor
MQVSVEDTGELGRKVRVEVPGGKINSEVDTRLQKMTKTTKIQGFRPGKVPLKIVRSKYGTQVRKEVIGELVQSSLYEAISQENMKPAGQPQIDDLKDESGEDLVFTASFEVYPEVNLKDVGLLEFEKPICEVTEDDVTIMIDMLRKQRRELKISKKAAKNGDVLNINFEGSIDGEAFEGGTGKSHELELGSNSFIAGFEDGLVGASEGENVVVNVKFPQEYGNEALKGKDAEFKVKVNSVNETVLPEVNETFMLEFNVKDGKKETLDNEIKRNMEREVGLTLRRQVKDAVLDALHEANEIELPQALVANEAHRAKQDFEKNLKQQGHNVKAIDSLDASVFNEQAKKRVSLQLILGELIKRNELKAKPEKVKEMIEQVASGYEDPSAVLNWYYSDKKNLAEVESLTLEDDVVDWVLAHAKVIDKACTFDEIMNKGQTAG